MEKTKQELMEQLEEMSKKISIWEKVIADEIDFQLEDGFEYGRFQYDKANESKIRETAIDIAMNSDFAEFAEYIRIIIDDAIFEVENKEEE